MSSKMGSQIPSSQKVCSMQLRVSITNEFTECGNGNIDLVLVLDGSGSIGADTFGQQIDFVS